MSAPPPRALPTLLPAGNNASAPPLPLSTGNATPTAAAAASPSPPSSSTATLMTLGVGIGIGGAMVLLCVGIWVIWIRRRNKRHGLDGETKDDPFRGPQHLLQQLDPPPTSNLSGRQQKLTPLGVTSIPHSYSVDVCTSPPHSVGSDLNSKKSVRLPASDTSSVSKNSMFTYEELALATENFSGSNLLGQGGFGYVHMGMLNTGKQVAIKQLKVGSGQGEREFQAEVETISRVKHNHLVALLGHCISGTQRLLVYEYVPNGTLEFHLHGKEKPPITWATRMKIAVGSAKGLTYLHEGCKPKIIHRDIKSSNILLDENFEAKVADFGLARLYSDTDTHVSTRVMGTFGYLAPEYALTGKLTDKSDVFSFGVVLLELITGRRPIDKSEQYLDDNIIDWARPLLTQSLEDGNFDNVADPRLQKDYNSVEMTRMVACASVSVRHLARRRPQMSQILRALEGDLTLDDLNFGIRPGESALYDSLGSSDFDVAYDTIQYKEDLRRFKKLALESTDHQNMSECSGPTSEFGPHPSGSSSETLRNTKLTQR